MESATWFNGFIFIKPPDMVITRERKQTNDKGKCDLKINDGNKSVRSIALIFIEYMGHSGSQPKNYI